MYGEDPLEEAAKALGLFVLDHADHRHEPVRVLVRVEISLWWSGVIGSLSKGFMLWLAGNKRLTESCKQRGYIFEEISYKDET